MTLRGFQRTEATAEGDLHGIGEVLPGEHQYRIRLECVFDFGEGGVIERPREIDVGDFCGKDGREWADGDGHGDLCECLRL